MLYLRGPVDPGLVNDLRRGDRPRAVVIGDPGRTSLRVEGLHYGENFEDPSAATVDTAGVIAIVGGAIVFLDDAEITQADVARKAAAAAAETARVLRIAAIRERFPIVVPADGDVLRALVRTRDARYGVYRRAFATAAVEGTLELVAEANDALHAWGEAVRAALPFPTTVLTAANYFSRSVGRNSAGSEHIIVDDSITVGRRVRRAGDALCKPRRRFYDLVAGAGVTSCVACIAVAETIVDPRRPAVARRGARS